MPPPAPSLPTFLCTAVALLAAVSGCVSGPSSSELKALPAAHRDDTAPAGLVDGRARFRHHFRASLSPADANGDSWLLRLDDEPRPGPPPAPVPDPLRRLHLVLVAGAFAECLSSDGLPFREAVPVLRQAGHRVETLLVGGRSGTEHNARQIAAYFEKHPDAGDLPLVMIGYSKGVADILGFLDHYPELARPVKAVVSIAGAVGGSPLADGASGLYALFSHLPSPDCPVGDGEVVRSLRTEVRREWMARARLPGNVRYYSLVAVADRGRVARVLQPAWRLLLRQDRRNDGQVLARDALLPNSTVLGYVQADHWAVALDLEQHRQFAVHRDDPRPFPRLALLQAVARQVQDDLGASPPAAQGGVAASAPSGGTGEMLAARDERLGAAVGQPAP